MFKIAFAVIWLLLAPMASPAQEVDAVLGKAATALGAGNLRTLKFSIAGSGYEVARGAPSTWKHIKIDAEIRQVDITLPSLQRGSRVINAGSSWEDQIELWAVPQVFVKSAAGNNSFLGEWKQGDALYNLVIFKVQGKLVSGYFNSQNLLEIVETRIQHPVLGDTPLQIVYSDYKDFGGVKFPTTIIQKLGGSLVSVLVVSDVQFQRSN
jgi:hypothetical protein